MRHSYRILGWVFLALGTASVAVAADPEESRVLSWNAHSIQFIDPPAFDLLTIPGAEQYRATVEQRGHTWRVESRRPRLDLSGIWGEIPTSRFTLTLEWLDRDGRVLAKETTPRIKAPDWSGLKEPAADWVAAADRNVAYLIRVADEGRAPYREPGVPVWIWSCASPTAPPSAKSLGPGFSNPDYVREFTFRAKRWPDGLDAGFPGCIVPAVIYAFVAHAEAGRPQKDRALELARKAADWSLSHRLPDSGAIPLFPYSTIANGKFGGYVEGESVNLLRASWLGLSLVRLHRATGDARYLEYARHIAHVTARFQMPDGNFPYRINPKTGAVTEVFSTGAIQFVLLVEALEPYGVDTRLRLAAERAMQWTLAYPVASHNWQGGYEDVREARPFRNLTQWEPQFETQYLARHRDRDPSYLPAARGLLRFIEDQFVIFGPGSDAHPVPVKGPLVFEQYVCWWPMEGHTGYYIQTLIELHRATGERIFLDKAMAAANAICAQQYESGAFSNWGSRWLEDGLPRGKDSGHNWYNTNAIASAWLYGLADYVRQLEAKPSMPRTTAPDPTPRPSH